MYSNNPISCVGFTIIMSCIMSFVSIFSLFVVCTFIIYVCCMYICPLFRTKYLLQFVFDKVVPGQHLKHANLGLLLNLLNIYNIIPLFCMCSVFQIFIRSCTENPIFLLLFFFSLSFTDLNTVALIFAI